MVQPHTTDKLKYFFIWQAKERKKDIEDIDTGTDKHTDMDINDTTSITDEMTGNNNLKFHQRSEYILRNILVNVISKKPDFQSP